MADSDLVQFDRRSGRLIAADVRRGLATAYENLPPGGFSVGPRYIEKRRWMPFYNNGNVTIPAHGAMAVTGSVRLSDVISGSANAEPILLCVRPSTTPYRYFVVNSGVEVPAQRFGECTDDSPLDVAVASGASLTIGDGLGPVPGSFELSEGYPQTALVLSTGDYSTRGIVRVSWKWITEFWGKVNGNTTKGSTGNVSIWAGPFGSESDTGIDVAGVGCPASNLTLNDKVNCSWMNGQPEMYPREC